MDNLRKVWYSVSKRKQKEKAGRFMSKYEKAELTNCLLYTSDAADE